MTTYGHRYRWTDRQTDRHTNTQTHTNAHTNTGEFMRHALSVPLSLKRGILCTIFQKYLWTQCFATYCKPHKWHSPKTSSIVILEVNKMVNEIYIEILQACWKGYVYSCYIWKVNTVLKYKARIIISLAYESMGKTCCRWNRLFCFETIKWNMITDHLCSVIKQLLGIAQLLCKCIWVTKNGCWNSEKRVMNWVRNILVIKCEVSALQ